MVSKLVQQALAKNHEKIEAYASVGADPGGTIRSVQVPKTLEASFTAMNYIARKTGLQLAPKNQRGMNLWQLFGRTPVPRNAVGMSGAALGTVILNGVVFDPDTESENYTEEDIEAGKILAEDYRKTCEKLGIPAE